VNFGERLLQDAIISKSVLREALDSLGPLPPSENNISLGLLKLGRVNADQLRTWATQKALEALNVVLAWDKGEIHFEESVLPPSDRLLVALSISSLLAIAQSSKVSTQAQEKSSSSLPTTPTTDVTKIPTLLEATQFSNEQKTPGYAAPVPAPTATNALFSARSLADDADIAFQSTRQEEAVRQVSVSSLIEPDALPPSIKSGTFQADNAAASPSTESFSVSLSGLPASVNALASATSSSISFVPPQPATSVTSSSRRFDATHMRPDMILMPADLSKLRNRSSMLQLTPDQWRLLTKVDGRTSLKRASDELSMPPAVLCQVAGELVINQLIQLLPPDSSLAQELSPTSREFMASGLGNGYVAPGYSAVSTQPWSGSVPPSPESPLQMPSPVSFESESQWGNGGNGASFVPGRGWVAAPQPPQAMSPGNSVSLSYSGISNLPPENNWR
jgi:hypothetical protein